MNVHRLAAGVLVHSPAKINLFFEILGKRSDGFHEIETLMAPVDLCDTLVAVDEPKGDIHLDAAWAAGDRVAGDGAAGDGAEALGELPPSENNLAYRAADLLRRRAGIDRGIRMSLVKRIPSAAGLGGGSSDAAAALLAANAVWGLAWSREALAELAAELGSDVPFFLGRGAALCSGRGERVEHVAGIGTLHLVIVRPPEGLSTAAVYGRASVPAEPRHALELINALRQGDERRLGELIYNRLEGAAEKLSPWIGRLRHELAADDCLASRMSGSGSAYFGICRHARHARRVARRLAARGLGRVYAASTTN